MANITSLIVKIGAQDAEITAALAKLGSNVKRTEEEFKKLGSTPVATAAQQSLKTLDDTVKQITTSQQRLADRAKIAAAGLTAIGGPARVTKNELEQINRTIQNGLDAYRALGQQAPAELQKVADAVTKQRKALADQAKPAGGGGLSGLLGAAGISTSFLTGAGVVAGLGAGAKAALDYADSLTKLADRTGISITALQRLGAIADASGNNVEQIASAVNAMQKRISEGADGTVEALGQIGLSVAQLKALSPDEQFIAIAKGVQSIKDPAEQTRIAMDLFGKSGAELLPTLKADVDSLADSTFKMSEDSVKALDDFGDGFGRLKTSGVNVLGELAASAIALVGSLAQFPDVLKRAQEAAAKRAPGERAPDVSIPGMLGQVPGNLPAGITPAQLQALIRGETAVAPAAPVAPQIAAIAPAAIDASRALDLLNAGLADEVKKATDSAAAAQRASEAHKKWADNFGAVTEKAKGFGVVVDTIDGSVVEGVKYYVDRGVSIGKVGEVYGLTAVQVEALSEKFAFEAKLATASAAIHAKLATEVYNVDTAFGKLQGRPLTKIPALQSGPNATLAALGKPFSQGLSDTLKTDLPKSIMAAIQGGGSVIQAAGSTMGSFLVSDKGFGKQLSGGLTSLFGKGISDAISNLLPGIGALLGPLLSKIGEKLKDAFGGPSKKELEGRDAEGAFQGQFKNFDAMVNAVGDAYAATGRSRADAQVAVKELLDAEKLGADAVAAAIERLQGVLDEAAKERAGASKYGLNSDELKQAAEDAKATLDYMTRSNLYTQDQLNQAYYDWQKALADAGNEAAKAWIATRDAVTNGSATASKAIDELRAKRDGLAQSIANEAPEEVMGVIESQIRGQIAALDAQLNAQQDAVDANQESASDAASNIEDVFGGCFGRVGQDGKRTAGEIEQAFNDLNITVKVNFDYGDGPVVPGAATGGLVVPGGIQHFDRGGVVLPFARRGTDTVPAMLTPGEIVLNAAQQGRVASALSRVASDGGRTETHVHVHVGDRELGQFVLDDLARGGKSYGRFRALVRGVA